jgi:hypothetical protein
MCQNNTRWHEKKFSMVKGAQTKLGGMKESKGSKTFEHTTKNNQYDDTQNQMKKKQRENAQT